MLFGNKSKIPKMSRDLFRCLSSRRHIHSIWGVCMWGSILLKFFSVKDSAVLDILQKQEQVNFIPWWNSHSNGTVIFQDNGRFETLNEFKMFLRVSRKIFGCCNMSRYSKFNDCIDRSQFFKWSEKLKLFKEKMVIKWLNLCKKCVCTAKKYLVNEFYIS